MTSEKISELKRKARLLKKELSIPHREALDIVAKENNFSSWCDLLSQNEPLKAPKKKLTFQECLDQNVDFTKYEGNPSDAYIGIKKNGSGGHTIVRKLSCLDYFDNPFNSFKSFKNTIEKDLQLLHKQNPNTFIYIVRIHINAPTAYMLDNSDKFIRKITKKCPWLHFLLLSVGSLNDITFGDMDLLEGFPEDIRTLFNDEAMSEIEYIDLKRLRELEREDTQK